MATHKRKFNPQYITSGVNKIPIGGQDRWYGQDMNRDLRYLHGVAGRMVLASYGVNSALLSGGLVTEGVSKTKVNITAAEAIAQFDIDVDDSDMAWAIPAPTTTAQIPAQISLDAQTDFDISGATLDGVTVNYLKLRYAETDVRTRQRAKASGTYNYVLEDSFQLIANSTAPTDYDVVLATFIGNGTSTLTITQRYPVGPAGQQMAEAADLGITYDGTDSYFGEKLKIAYGRGIGDLVITDITRTPTAWSASRSAANPSYPEYFPAIPRHDATHDVTTTNVPQSVVDVFRAVKVTAGSTTDFTGTVSGSVITFTAGDADYLLAGLVAAGLVNQWHVSEAANFAASGALYTGARQYCINIAGTDYAITGVDTAARTITVSGSPTTGSQTAIVYAYRIAGSTISFRLRKLSGFVPVAGGDQTGEVLISLAKMDRGQGHWHTGAIRNFNASVAYTGDQNVSQGNGTPNGSYSTAQAPSSDGTNGTPRTGKTTDPRTYGVAVYTHVRSLLVAV